MRHHVVAALAVAGLTWACGEARFGPETGRPTQGATAAPSAAFAYVAFGRGGDGGIAAYRMDLASGALEPMATVGLRIPAGLAADPSGRFLYTVDNADDFPAGAQVIAYRIEPTGALSEVNRLSAPARWSKGGRLLGVSDRSVYVLLNDSSTGYSVGIMVYQIGTDGGLKEVGYSGTRISCCLQFFELAGGGQAAFMDSGGSGRVVGYRTNPDGTLAAVGEAPTAGTPTAGVLHPSGRWLLVGGNLGLSGFIASYAAGSGTLLGPVSSAPSGFTPSVMVADPRGRFVFGSNYADVMGYRIDAQSGELREVPVEASIDGADALAFDPNGRFLYLADYSRITAYAVSPMMGTLRRTDLVTRLPDFVSAIAVVAVP